MTLDPNARFPRAYFRFLFYALILVAVLFVAIWNNRLEDFNPKQGTNAFRGIFDKYIGMRGENQRKSKLKYDRIEPLRQMFSVASKSEEREQKEGRTKPAFPVRLSDLKELENKKKVLLLVIVSTAPLRKDRRSAIRDTWWKACDGVEVACKFFTDGLQLSAREERALTREQRKYKDIEFQALESSRNFGLRYLYHIMWATAKYDFTYFLRADDDYFVCLERLINELYHRPDKGLSWGSYHCGYEHLIYPDEAWTLFTSDVIERFLSQDPREILCHPHADQQIPVWMDAVYKNNETLVHFDDHRLHHYPPVREDDRFKYLPRVCETFLGLHGTSPEFMQKFGFNSGDTPQDVSDITDVSETCPFPRIFNISEMGPPYKFDLRPCIDNPRWTPREGMWLGIRQGSQAKENVELLGTDLPN